MRVEDRVIGMPGFTRACQWPRTVPARQVTTATDTTRWRLSLLLHVVSVSTTSSRRPDQRRVAATFAGSWSWVGVLT